MKLFVRNFPYDLTEDRLKEIFEAVGAVSSAKIVMDRYTGKSRGFGFVEMGSSDEGKAAIEQLNDTEIDGRKLVVDQAHDGNR